MNQIFTVAKQIIAYGADHPGLLNPSTVASAQYAQDLEV